MKQAIKYGIYVAAGVGIFEILRRTGLLAKAGEWLQEQVPDDLKDKARDIGHDLKDQVHGAMDQVRDRAGHFVGKAKSRAQDMVDQGKDVAGKVADHLSNGVAEMTSDSDGAAIPHKVGRGVIH